MSRVRSTDAAVRSVSSSAETAARAALLTHYFYTSDELIHGVVTPPLKKVTLVATSEAQLTEMVKGVQAGVPAGHTLNETVRRAFPHTKLTLIVGGYDVIPPP